MLSDEGGKLSQIADGSLIGLILVAPIAAGSWRLEVLPVLVALGVVGLVALLLHLRTQGRSLHLHGLTIGLLLLVLYTALQAVPLPESLLRFLSPTASELRSFVTGDGGGPISYEPAASLREAAKLCLYAMVVILAHERTRRRRSSDLVTQPVLIAGLLVSAIGLLHRALGIDRLFGIFDTSVAVVPMITTFVNPNHAAGFMTLGALTGLGLAVSERPRHLRVAALIGVLFCAGMSMVLLSRGGLVSLAIGGAGFALLYWWRGRKEQRSAGWLLGSVAALSLLALVAGLTYGSERLSQEVVGPDGSLPGLSEKLAAVKDAIPMAEDHALVGIGRGAYVSAYTRYKKSPLQLTFAFPENIAAQLLSEWGVGLGTLALLGLLLALGLRFRSTTHVSSLGALAGVTALVVHNLVDFSLEMPGVAIPVAALLGAVSSRQLRNIRLPSLSPLSLALVAVLSLSAAAGTFGAFQLGDLAREHARVDARLVRDTAAETPEPLREEECAAVMSAHPANASLSAKLAYGLEVGPEPDLRHAIRWANRTMYLAPTYADGYVLSGRILIRTGHRRQGFIELRRAVTLTTSDRLVVLRQVIDMAKDADEVSLAIPRRDEALDLLDAKLLAFTTRFLVQSEREDWARELLSDNASLEGLDPSELTLLSLAATQVGDEVLAIEAAGRRVELAPSDQGSILLQARLLISAGKLEEARAMVDRAPLDPEDPAPMLRMRLRTHVLLKDYPAARGEIQEMRRLLQPTRQNLTEIAGLEADLELNDGHTAKALATLNEALALEPGEVGLRFRRAVLLRKSGRLQEAKVDAEFVLKRQPSHAAARRLLSSLDQP